MLIFIISPMPSGGQFDLKVLYLVFNLRYIVTMTDVFSVYRSYFVAASLGAHSNFYKTGFRQKDVRFLLGLFLNWMDSTTKGVDDAIHKTQISRYINALVKDGYAERIGSSSPPRYLLTRTGLLELVRQFTQMPMLTPVELFFFIQVFVRTYGERLKELVALKENRLPRSYQVELEALLDLKELFNQQMRAIQLEIRKLEERIRETKGAQDLANKLVRRQASIEEIVSAVSEQFPYDLNSHKPMNELFHEVPPHLRVWELSIGNKNRAEFLWQPTLEFLKSYLQQLTNLALKDKNVAF